MKETVTIERDVDPRIADLVQFASHILSLSEPLYLSNDSLLELAKEYWEREHGDE